MNNEPEALRRRRAEVRRILWDWGHAAEYCRKKQEEIAALQQMADDARDTLGAQRITGMPRGGGLTDATVMAVTRICDTYRTSIDAIAQQIEEIMRRKRMVDDCVADLPLEHKRILELRYCKEYGWVMTAAKLNYTEEHAKKLDRIMVDRLSREIEVDTF